MVALAEGPEGDHEPPYTPPPLPSRHAGRDPGRGTFAKGNKAAAKGVGRARVAELRGLLIASVRNGSVKAVARKVEELALAGDVGAARLWLEYVIGRPTQAVELSGPDGAPIETGGRVEAVVLSVLAGHPDLRVRVADALLAADNEGGEPG